MDPQNDGQQGFAEFLALASLGTQTYLASQAIGSRNPSTYQVNRTGQLIATGGGAPSFTGTDTGGLFSGSTLWLVGILVLILVLVFSLGK